jgi:hypothetical protein
LFVELARALPLYASASNATYGLVLCRGLDAAVAELKLRELDEHGIGAAWLERDCVSIDPCEQTSSNEDPYFGLRLPALAGAWLSGNSSALRLALGYDRVTGAQAGVRAENYGSMEFARVPEGLRLDACAPDFDRWRRDGVLACNEDTLVSFAADATARACPGAQGFSLVDCLRPLQFDAGVHTLLRRPETEKMHFGSLTRAEACASPASALAAALCADAAEYSMEVPVAAALGSTSLVRYQFLPGYGCLGENSLAGEGQDKVLSRAAAPNRVVACPSVANGAHARVDAYTCGVVCDAGFELQAGACVSQCTGLNATCEPGYAAAAVCVEGPQTLYNCSACPPRAGFGAAPFAAGAPYECQYAACAAGARSVGGACVPCPVNAFSNASEATSCAACDTLGTGLYQRAAGQTACHACLWRVAEVAPSECAPGAELALSWARVEALFELYAAHAHNVSLAEHYESFCTEGYACLPCEPGHFDAGGVCVPCGHGFYQANIGATECHACAAGQNTSSPASTRSSDCVCDPGFE